MRHSITALAVSTLAILACGGVSEPAVAPLDAPPLLHPVTAEGGCAYTDLATGTVVAKTDSACGGWTIATSPKDPKDHIVSPKDGVPIRNGAALEAPGEAELDAVGFDADGGVVAYLSTDADVKLDDRRKKAWVMVNRKKVFMDYEDASMFGIVVCEAQVHGTEGWKVIAGPTPVQLYEGMTQPWCSRLDGAPDLVGLQDPSGDGYVNVETDPVEDLPPELLALATEENRWHKVDGHDLVIQGLWFEGWMANTPVAAKTGETWVLLEGLEKPEQGVDFTFRDGLTLACTNDGAHLYDAEQGYARVWSGPAPCPAFWP